MGRGICRVVVLCCGLAACPVLASSKQHESSNQDLVNALNNLAAALDQQQKPGDQDKPCPDRNDNRGSELCAQWKSADESQRSANEVAWFGGVGSVIEAATFVAALAAAIAAGRAARHTKTNADEAARAADAAQMANRPWVQVEIVEKDQFQIDHRGVASCTFKIVMKNTGKSAATGVMYKAILVPLVMGHRDDAPVKQIKEIMEGWENNAAVRGATLFPNDATEPKDVSDISQGHMVDGEIVPTTFLVGIGVRYTWGNEIHHTIKSYTVDTNWRLKGVGVLQGPQFDLVPLTDDIAT